MLSKCWVPLRALDPCHFTFPSLPFFRIVVFTNVFRSDGNNWPRSKCPDTAWSWPQPGALPGGRKVFPHPEHRFKELSCKHVQLNEVVGNEQFLHQQFQSWGKNHIKLNIVKPVFSGATIPSYPKFMDHSSKWDQVLEYWISLIISPARQIGPAAILASWQDSPSIRFHQRRWPKPSEGLSWALIQSWA